ncbi:acetyl-CoA C-acetyltransferase [Parenemella sanctibonifatiensis]|uniref:Acetyl-CoA acetyltransferase n=1 Tax=Parenemella sanctibonifatiensis TaxID=2016505 RepID=A0A255EH24_9ACTN|nr:acetyl-CoA C-acetyltransferase [Parenemella sanctibonifatiensis]OYN90844.1 acetyl-CoA acetyltransferase [Parenemella sanctibonifatiensis]
MIDTPRRVAVLGGNRTPFARANTAYRAASNHDLLTAALDGLVARFGLAGERLGQVTAGAVLKHSRDFNLTREAVLSTSLDPSTPASDVQMACATGLEATITIANKIALGQIDVGVSGGSDTTSDAPIAVSEGLRRLLLNLGAAKTVPQQLKAIAGFRPQHLAPLTPSVAEPRTGLSMGQHMARTAEHWKLTREAQDEVAAASHRNLAAAYERGFFDDLITPYLGLAKDNTLRPDSTVDKLAKLKTVFGDPATATMTAGNSTPLTDGASAVLLAEETWAASHGIAALAWLIDAETAAVDFVHGAEGLLMAPVHAVPRLLARNDLSLADFDIVEIHEAFAATVLATLSAWESEEYCREELGLSSALGSVDRSKLNVNGSSLATGHPFAATGGRIVASAAKQLAQLKAADGGPKRALISVCAAGGQGAAMILEA